jgi:hypothetical protein
MTDSIISPTCCVCGGALEDRDAVPGSQPPICKPCWDCSPFNVQPGVCNECGSVIEDGDAVPGIQIGEPPTCKRCDAVMAAADEYFAHQSGFRPTADWID